MENQKKTIVILLLVIGSLTPAIQAKSPGVLLQEGLYAEETEGDLEKAIEIYQQVIDETGEIQRLAAKATYQLGMCHLKKGENEKSAKYFQQVISNYSTQKTLVKKAKEQLKKVKPETKESVFERIDGQVIQFLAEQFGKIALEAGQQHLAVNSHVYYIDPNGFRYQGGMNAFYNWTGRTLTKKVNFGGTSYPNQTHYGVDGNKLNTEILPDKTRPNHWQIYWTPDEPLAPEEHLYYGWSLNDKRKLPQLPGGVYSLNMQNKYGSPVVETFFLVLPKELKISQSNPPTGSQELLNFNVYWWAETVKQGENHVERVQLKKVPEIVGRWQSVDFVSSPDQFQPGIQRWRGDLFLKEVIFNSDGSSSKSWKWTSGWIHAIDGDAKAQYYIENFEGEKYLFLPWLSGDVTIRGQKPKYYVLKAVERVQLRKNDVQKLVENFFKNNYRDITRRKTLEWGKQITHDDGNISIRYKYEATIWDKDKIVKAEIFTFNKDGKFVSVINAELDPLKAEELVAEGWKLWGQRKLAEAESKFHQAIRNDPDNDGAYQGLGWAQLNQGKKKNAENSFNKCIKLNPKNSAALNGLGWIAHGHGEMDEAIKWWKRAVKATPGATASLGGLTQVYMEQKEYDKAIKYYEMWLKAEPDNKNAREGLKKASAKLLNLTPAPWVDGEVMEVRLKRPAGNEYGTVIYSAQSNTLEDNNTWQIISHMYVTEGAISQYTFVEAEAESFAPIYGQTTNWMGDFVAEYNDGNVKLTVSAEEGKESIRDISVQGTAYDNEQALYLIRRMPLAENYEGSFPIFSVQGGAKIECRIKVLGTEDITVEAGTFTCYKTDLSIYMGEVKTLQHTLWFSVDEHKYLVKYDVGGTATMELVKIWQRDKDKPLTFENEEPAFSVTMPTDWRFYNHGTGPQFSLQLISPDLKAWTVLVWQKRGTDPDSASAMTIAKADCEKLKGFFENYTADQASWKEFEIAGLEAAQYVANYQKRGTGLQAYTKPQEMVEYRTYIVDESNVYWFVFRVEKDEFEKNKTEFDSIVNSFKIDVLSEG